MGDHASCLDEEMFPVPLATPPRIVEAEKVEGAIRIEPDEKDLAALSTPRSISCVPSHQRYQPERPPVDGTGTC
jgi:hypothetical protein